MRRPTATFLAALSAMVLFSSFRAEARELTPREIYKTYGKAVVLVFATDGSAAGSAGTGSIITNDGQIITNAHVVAKEGRPYKKLFVYTKPDKISGSMKDDLQHRHKVTLVDIDHDLDLALLRMVDPPADLPTIEFVDPDAVEIGEPVVAIGHPETGGLWTLTTGSISSIVKDFQGIRGKDVFQTEASVNRGNSGGPLLNAYGQMVGINTCISRRSSDGIAITDINFSLKSSVPVEWMKRRRLMNLAYAKPGVSEAVGALAAAPTTPPATKPEVKETVEVESGEGKTLIAVVEPPADQEVADDPEWGMAASSGSQQVSRGMKSGAEAKAQKKPDKVKTKHLTKRRPYQLDPFVSARVKEIRALEKDMEDMSQEIDRRRGRKGKRPKGYESGNGLW